MLSTILWIAIAWFAVGLAVAMAFGAFVHAGNGDLTTKGTKDTKYGLGRS